MRPGAPASLPTATGAGHRPAGPAWRPDAALLLLLTAAILLAVAWPMIVGTLAPGFPLDDGWIHATYARNLAERGEFALNPGTPSTGTTSLLWTVLLALALKAGIPVTTAALGGGSAAMLALVAVWHRLLGRLGASRAAAFAATAVLPCSGILLWWTLSGMETVLFLLLAVLAMDAFHAQRHLRAGLWLGLLLLARPEGVLLAPVLAVAAWRRDAGPRAFLPLLAPVAAGLLVYLAWNLAVSGAPWTSTLEGRRWLALGGREQGGPFDLPLAWADMLWRWFRILASGMLRDASPGTWIAGIGAALALALRIFRKGKALRLAPGIVTWAVLHSLAYAVVLPYPGHAGRYLAPLLLAISAHLAWLLSLPGTQAAPRRLAALLLLRVLPAAMLLAGGTLLAISAVHSWSKVWHASVDHITRVHRGAAEWVRDNTPRDAAIACYDIGAMAWFAQRRVVDLGGLTDPAAVPFMRGGIDEYILSSGAPYVAMVAPFEGIDAPGFIPHALGYGASGDLSVHTVREFHIPPSANRRHIALTGNAYPRILLQKVRRSL